MGALRELASDSQREAGPDGSRVRGARPRPRLRLLGIGPAQASFERRGFTSATAAAQARLEEAGRTFLRGYHAALANEAHPALERALTAIAPELRGFAYEGAAMALALLDRVAPWRRDRLEGFIAGPARDHVYMAHVGAGWAFARLRLGVGPIRSLDPLLRWLALDGYGFHQGYFDPAIRLRRTRAPRRFEGYALRAFDQGLGRSLWFAAGADPGAIASLLDGYERRRLGDLWSGVALAATYAGGATADALEQLGRATNGHTAHVRQGTAFAIAARSRAGNPAAHSDLACGVLVGRSPHAVATLVADAARDLPPDGAVPSYESWRARIRDALGEAA